MHFSYIYFNKKIVIIIMNHKLYTYHISGLFLQQIIKVKINEWVRRIY